MKPFMICLAVVLAVIRPIIVFHPLGHTLAQSYQAVAHLTVGSLFGAWYAEGEMWLLWTALSLSMVEVVCAILTLAVR